MSVEERILARIPSEWGKYLDIGPGWYSIVDELDKQIAALDPNYKIAQVKEKFGGLRYYTAEVHSSVFKEVQDLIQAAEIKASQTCEECGEPGSLNTNNYWYKTVCDQHNTRKPRKS